MVEKTFVVKDGLRSFIYDNEEGLPKVWHNVPVNMRWCMFVEPSNLMLGTSQFPCIIFHMHGARVHWCFAQSTIRDETYTRLSASIADIV